MNSVKLKKEVKYIDSYLKGYNATHYNEPG